MWKSNVPILIFGNSPWGHTSKFYKVFPVISAVMSDTNSPEIAHILQTRHSAAPPQDFSCQNAATARSGVLRTPHF